MSDKLTAEELAIVEALRDCDESEISRELPRRCRMTFAQLGALWGVSKERVRQIERDALRKIRRRIVHDAKLRTVFAQLKLTLDDVCNDELRR